MKKYICIFLSFLSTNFPYTYLAESLNISNGGKMIGLSKMASKDCLVSPIIIDTTDMDRSTIWYSSSYIGHWADGDCRRQIDMTKVVGDTLIGNRLCRIIGVTSGGQYFPESEIIEYSKDGKIYFYEDEEWKLLYDFDAQVGDTVTYHISKKYPYYTKFGIPAPFDQELINANPYQLVIKNIDTIYDNSGKPLKRFFTEGILNVHGHYMGDIIERIGSKEKLFGNNVIIIPPQCDPTEEGVGLRCFSDDDTFIKFTMGLCDMLTQTHDEATLDVSLFPNPGRDQIYLSMGDGTTFPIKYKVSDIYGRALIRETNQNSDVVIITDKLFAGIYFISIQDASGNVSSLKWIKE